MQDDHGERCRTGKVSGLGIILEVELPDFLMNQMEGMNERKELRMVLMFLA